MEFRNLTWVGLLTIVIVAAPGLTWELQRGPLNVPRTAAWIAAQIAFTAFFLLNTRKICSAPVETGLIALQAAIALGSVALHPNPFTGVLLVIVAGQLGEFRIAVGILWITVQSAILYAVLFNRTDPALTIVTAFFGFQLFGFFTVRIAHQEVAMRQKLAEANTELKVATELLEIESRGEERLRISRDLHDLIGHHLTALSLNLEVATHLTDGPAREHIEKSKALAKLLLSDVRDVVGRLRESEPIDLGAAVESLRDVVGRPAMHLDVPHDLSVSDSEIAKVALRAIQEIVTNAARHSGARNLWVTVAGADHALTIDAHDDGVGSDELRFGHGLNGMRERVEEMHGSLEVSSSRGSGWTVHVRLPLEESRA